MTQEELKKRIDIAAKRRKADLVIKNCKIVNVFAHCIEEGDIAFSDGVIAGIGTYSGEEEIDANGKYAVPGLMDGHIHIESSYVTPEELGRLLVTHGTTTIIADPHEIVNVCGLEGMEYMLRAAKHTALNIKYVLPSCVPATPFEHSGACVSSDMMHDMMEDEQIIGLGEFMDFPGVVNAEPEVLNKLLESINQGKLIDGHSPGLTKELLNAYICAHIRNDHECASVSDMQERIARGMYVLLRQGSCCKDLRSLLKGVTKENARRCVLCSDDRQPHSIFEVGHLEEHLKICVEEGIDAITAIQMATINTAECFELKNRGAIAPGYIADLVLMENLKDFQANQVFINGALVAKEGNYLPEITREDVTNVKGSFHVKEFSKEKLKLNSKSDFVNAITIIDDGVVTKKETVKIKRTSDGDFIFDSNVDLAKIAVVERHQNTGNVAVALLKGYGIKEGAIALSIAHDSHNIIVVGVNDDDMELAVKELVAQEGGMVLINKNEVIARIAMPIGGLMSTNSGEWVNTQLSHFHETAYETLKISRKVEPVMTLCFMSLAVIPEIKLTDMGLFDVSKFEFISIEADLPK